MLLRAHLSYEASQMLDEIIHSMGFHKHRYPEQSCFQVMIHNTYHKLDARRLINREYKQVTSSAS